MARTATVRLSEEDEAKLARIGARSGLSVSAAIRRAIDGLERELEAEAALGRKTTYEAYLEIMEDVPDPSDDPVMLRPSVTNETVRQAFAKKQEEDRIRNDR